MLSEQIRVWLEQKFGTSLHSWEKLHGGDINQVYKVSFNKELFVLKINDNTKYPGLFEKEARGLQLLVSTDTFGIPNVVSVHGIEKTSILLLKYVPPGPSINSSRELFGNLLATMHQTSSDYFGLDHDNYIGSIPQKNTPHKNGIEFYIQTRLLPQFNLAQSKGYSFKTKEKFLTNLKGILPNEKPSLIHGDLWSGNYITDKSGQPWLIDPAVCFASREMDIAMMQLFGGFDPQVFNSYNSVFPLESGWKNRLPLWQLYYLLVHLNIFGSNYYHPVNDIVIRYS